MQADLHVHSRYSTRPSQWFLQKIGCPESFTEPLHLYHVARRRGMTLVTITDHNQIAGAREIAHLPGTFISEEVTAYFPEDQCKVHVLAYGITEAEHADIQKARENVYDLVAYLRENRIAHVLAHPFYSVNDRLTVEHVEKLLLLFRHFELNGDINTCEADGPGREPRLHVFAPIGVYEFEDFPEQRLVYPPVLEMLDFCYRRGIRRLHLASDGPTGLAGLFIARFLKIPFDATYSDRMLRLARGATRDSFIEDLCWKYTVWFYHQAERVFVASRARMQELAARGLAPEKMHPLRSQEERAVDRRSASAAECAAAV